MSDWQVPPPSPIERPAMPPASPEVAPGAAPPGASGFEPTAPPPVLASRPDRLAGIDIPVGRAVAAAVAFVVITDLTVALGVTSLQCELVAGWFS